MKKFLCIALLLLLAGCGTAKPVPDWFKAGSKQLEIYKKNFLSGNEKIAAIQFKGVLNEIKKSGDLEVLARAHLTRMALQTAVLEDLDNEEYLKIDALSPNPLNRSFYAFLRGEMDQVDEKLLPQQYLGFIKTLKGRGDIADHLEKIGQMEDPLSQLNSLGILVRMQRYNEAVLQKALDIASVQGWKRAVFAYLERLKSVYEARKEGSKALDIEQRIKLIGD